MRYFPMFIFLVFSISGKSQITQNQEFEQSKGKWPPPISNFKKFINDKERNAGFHFEVPHKGLTILPDENDSVKAVFKGKVISVFRVGDSFALMTRYGNYFITYVNLDSPGLKKGDMVTQGEFLGLLSRTNRQLELMLTNEKDKELDPFEWIQWPAVLLNYDCFEM